MARRNKQDQRNQMIWAAQLYANGENQTTIAKILEQTQSTISRHITDATEAGLIRIERVFDKTKLNSEEQEILQKRLEPDNFQQAIDAWVKFAKIENLKIKVYPSGSRDVIGRSWQERSVTFSRLAAPDFLALLQQKGVKNVGVTWGSQIFTMLQQLKNHSVPKRADLKAIPLCAELNAEVNLKFSSSFLAQELDEVFKGDSSHLSLGGVPAILSNRSMVDNFSEQYAKGNAPYAQVFGEKGLVHSLDAIVTSVGQYQKPYGKSFKYFRKASGMRKEKIAKLIVGDIGGVLMPAKLDENDKESFDTLKDLWTGVKLEHLEDTDVRAQGKMKPGIIVIAIGAAKARVCLEATRYGASHLLIDDELANEIVTLWKDGWDRK